MVEYPTIANSSKAPRKPMIAFEKLDGSNIRAKWTPKRGFHLFGSREQLLDETHPHLGGVVAVFRKTCQEPLEALFRDKFRQEKEVTVYGEYLGPNTFAGWHTDPVEQMRFVPFDFLVQKKGYVEFVLPQDFVELTADLSCPVAQVIYEGNLTDGFIDRVRMNDFIPALGEGVVCKGRERSGAYRGKVWMCKVKTNTYRERLKQHYGVAWTQYWE
jgi:hypothetical protein